MDKQNMNLQDAHNVMTDGEVERIYREAIEAPFLFDLQRFGHHHGKSGGKIFASIAGFIVGFTTPWLFGAKAFAAGVMGASLFGSVWSATHQQNVDSNGSADVSRFDRAQETMSSDAQIPIVYGTRQISGNQTFHQTNADANTLHKHVVLCEGGIEGVVSVMASDMIIPTGSQTGNTVFTIMNNKYPDARVRKHGQDFDLWAGDNHHHIHLCTKKEVENSHDTYWEYQVSVSSLISYINQLYAEGWQAFPVAATNNYPGDLWDAEGNVYVETPWSKLFENQDKYNEQNHVTIDGKNGFINFCADTIRGGTNYTFHDCESPSNYNEVGGYPAMAWLDMDFIVSNELNGNPSVSAVVMGKKVYDTRTKKTAYSTNPAMCLRDFMLSKRYGLGRWITADDLDEDSWNRVADYCDEEISFLDASGAIIRAKRFELNMVIDQKNSALDWVQEILANFQGYLTLTNGKFKLHIEQQTDVSYKFNDDNCSDLSVTPLSLNDTPNKYTVKIIDPRNNWSSVACNVEDYADQKERQKIITKEVNLNGTTSQYQALRLARFYRDQNLACPLTLSWKTGINGMHLEPGDVVTISYHGVFTELPVRITEIKQDDDGKFNITGRQYNDTIYGDALGGGVHWYNYTDTTQTVEKRTPSNPTNLKAYTQYRRYEDGTTGYDIICSYELPQRYDVETGLVYYKTNHMTAAQIGTFKEGEVVDSVGLSREWIYAGDSPTKIVISNAKVGDIYEFRVQSRTTDGLISSEASAPTVTIKVTAKETVPSQPYNLTYDFTKSFTFKWSDVPDSDVMYYEIRTDTNVGLTIGLLGKTQSTSIDVNLIERKGTVYVYSVNTLKKYSYPAKVTYNYPKPDAPSYIHFTEALRGVNVLVAPFPARVKSMRLYVEGHNISKSFDLNNASYTFNGEPDIYNFWASYVDLMGEGYTSVKYAYTIKPEMNPEWLKDEAISLNKVDKTIQSAVADAQQAIPRLDGIDNDIVGINNDLSVAKSDLANDIADINNDLSAAKSDLENDIRQINEDISSVRSDLSQARADVNADVKTITDKLSLAPSDPNGYKSIQELNRKDGELESTIASNKATQDGVNETNASLISQNDSAIKTMVLNLNSDANGNTYRSISSLYQTAEGIKSTVDSNKSATDNSISQLSQKADSIKSTIENNLNNTDPSKSAYKSISQLSQTANEIKSTVQTNKTNTDSAISQVSQKADNVKVTIENNLNNTDPSKSAYKSISQLSQTANEIKTTVQTNKTNSDSAISQVSQKADNVKVTIENNLNNTDPSKSAYRSISQLQVNINGLTSTVQENKSATDTQISQIKQNANSLSSTVQNYHTDANNQISGLSSRITQNANSITSVITNLSDAESAKNNYSAIAQLQDDIALRVAKDDVINQINISKESILIDGKKVHITGDTHFDNNVVVRGMIAAGAITADKLSASTMELTANQGIKGGGATLDTNGLTVRGNDGSYVVHGSNGMEFHDGNGNTFAMVGAIVMGTVKDGQWIKFTKPWKNVPNVIVTPISLQTAIPGYNSTNLYLDCRAQNVTKNGFQAVCRTVLKAGSGGVFPVNKLASRDLSDLYNKGIPNLTAYTYDISEIKVPDKATKVTINSSWAIENIGDIRWVSHDDDDEFLYYFGDIYVDLRIDVNGSTIKTKRLGSSLGQKTYEKFKESKYGNDSEIITVSGGDTIKIYGVISVQTVKRGDFNPQYSDSYEGFGKGSASYTLANYSFNTTADAPLASGNAFFLCTDQHNSPYTISDS